MCNSSNTMLKFIYCSVLLVGILAHPDAKLDKIAEYLMNSCFSNGAGSDISRVLMQYEDYKMCLYTTGGSLGLADLDKDINTIIENFTKNVCDNLPALRTCFTSLTNGTKPCLRTEAHYFIPRLQKYFDRSMDYICRDNRTIIKTLISDGSFECLLGHSNMLPMCHYDESIILGDTQKACRRYSDIRSCLTQGYKDICPTSSITAVLNTLIDMYTEEVVTECSELNN